MWPAATNCPTSCRHVRPTYLVGTGKESGNTADDAIMRGNDGRFISGCLLLAAIPELTLEAVLPMQDGLAKQRDFSAELGSRASLEFRYGHLRRTAKDGDAFSAAE